MHTFIIIWLGQFVSTIGSQMTFFAITIWAWEKTGSATALALVSFFFFAPSILTSLLAGTIVDRVNRKVLMIISDTVTALATLAILLIYLSNTLQIWHLYIIAAVISPFNQIQQLSYQVSITTLVPKHHYTRASSMGSILSYGSSIIAPALAGSLYPMIGLVGIILIDLVTFVVAIATLAIVPIPQPKTKVSPNSESWRKKLAFGFHYIGTRPSLLALLTITSLFWLFHDVGDAVYNPMILARTDGNAVILGQVASAAGVGGVTGAVLVSFWGGLRRRIHGILLGMIGAGASKILFGLGQMPLIWIPAQFCSSLNFPLLGSSNQAIWFAKVEPEVQGRVFAVSFFLRQVVSASGALFGGPLADYVLEPAMKPGGILAPLFGGIFGTESGAGIALLYVTCALCMMLIGLSGYAFGRLKDVEDIVPDCDAST